MSAEYLYLPQSSRCQGCMILSILKVIFCHSLVPCSELNTSYLYAPQPDYQFMVKNGLLQMHTYIHTIWNIQSLVYSSDGKLLGSNVKASSLGIGGLSLTRCRMFSVRSSSFGEVNPYLFSTKLIVGECTHFAPVQLIVHPSYCP